MNLDALYAVTGLNYKPRWYFKKDYKIAQCDSFSMISHMIISDCATQFYGNNEYNTKKDGSLVDIDNVKYMEYIINEE